MSQLKIVASLKIKLFLDKLYRVKFISYYSKKHITKSIKSYYLIVEFHGIELAILSLTNLVVRLTIKIYYIYWFNEKRNTWIIPKCLIEAQQCKSYMKYLVLLLSSKNINILQQMMIFGCLPTDPKKEMDLILFSIKNTKK